MNTDRLAEVMANATKGPWGVAYSEPQEGWNGSTIYACPKSEKPGFTVIIADIHGPQSDDDRRANAALIAMAPDLAAEVLRLRADVAQLIAANAALVVRNDALLAFVEEVRDCRPDVISGRAHDPQDDMPDMIEAETFYAFQADAEKLAPKPKKDAA